MLLYFEVPDTLGSPRSTHSGLKACYIWSTILRSNLFSLDLYSRAVTNKLSTIHIRSGRKSLVVYREDIGEGLQSWLHLCFWDRGLDLLVTSSVLSADEWNTISVRYPRTVPIRVVMHSV